LPEPDELLPSAGLRKMKMKIKTMRKAGRERYFQKGHEEHERKES
jgi:hypothetical protein